MLGSVALSARATVATASDPFGVGRLRSERGAGQIGQLTGGIGELERAGDPLERRATRPPGACLEPLDG